MRISDRAERKELNGEHPKMYPLELYPGPRSRVLGPAALVMMMTVMMVMMMMIMMMMMVMMVMMMMILMMIRMAMMMIIMA